MDRIAVDGVDVAFFVVLKDDIAPERTSANDVLISVSLVLIQLCLVLTYPVGHDVPILLVHNETSRLTR